MDRMHYLASPAGEEIGRTLDAWQAKHPDMGLLAMLPEAEKDALPLLQAECAQRGIPLVGGIFPELLADNAFRCEGCWLLRFDEMPHFALHENLTDKTAAEAAAEISAELHSVLKDDARNNTLFLLFDAMVPNISSLLDELYLQLANRVHYVGANAGSETFQPMPCLFDGERVVGNGVLAMLLTPHSGAVLEHGYQLPPQSMTATSTEGNRIEQIDWRPAFEVYRELVHAQFGVEIDHDNFYQYAVHFPFGIVRANHSVVVRIPVALGDDGSLFCVGEVPPHSVLALLEAPEVDSTQTLDTLTAGLQELNGDLAGSELLLFYCAGRRMHVGVDAATAEVSELAQRTRAGRIAGALSLGEIGGSTLWSYPLFHNATLVASLW
jgi:hypothetical protein